MSKDPFDKFGALSAMVVGGLSILYAIFFLFISKASTEIGVTGAWIILTVSGLFSSAAYVALYNRLKTNSQGFALWALLLGVGASLTTMVHGGYQVFRLGEAATLSETDPNGLAAFGIVGVVALVFGWLIVRGGGFNRNLGYLGIVNAVLLIVLYGATAAGSTPLILLSGGLTSVILGPIWWIWVGRELQKQAA